MNKLAILGGAPTFDKPLSLFNSIGDRELKAATSVIRSGCLSKFLGVWGDDFLGGETVRNLESSWSERFRVKHSISMNSATSGLFASMGAIGLGPGDEVIVPPWTMSATAMAPLVYGGIPVFADIEEETFCLDPKKVADQITPKTRAIIAVNLFGHPAKLKELRQLADKHDIKLVEDNAQGPLCQEFGKYGGTVGHIGVFSLNYHKHLHTGEGGVCVTDDDELAVRLQLIRNHGENAVEPCNMNDITNMIGFNYRMTEIAAAIASVQLTRIDELVERWIEIAESLSTRTAGLRGLTPPVVREGCRHVYYGWCMRYDEVKVGIPRDLFAEALRREGVPVMAKYVTPLYLLPTFQRRIAIGGEGFPFNLSTRKYESGLCPVVEKLQNGAFLSVPACAYALTKADVIKVGDAIERVYESRRGLEGLEQKQRVTS